MDEIEKSLSLRMQACLVHRTDFGKHFVHRENVSEAGQNTVICWVRGKQACIPFNNDY